MGAVLEGIGAVFEGATGAAALAQGAHENGVQYRQDALTGADARRQNERLLNGPGAFPGYSENVQGYTSPNAPMYGSTPQFTDGAPQQGGTLPPDMQLSAQPVGGPIMFSPDGQYASPVIGNVANAVMPQQGFDVGSAMGGQSMYLQPQGYAPAFTSPFGLPPVFFTDTAPTPNVVQAVAPTSRKR